jgi:hypothetical protein
MTGHINNKSGYDRFIHQQQIYVHDEDGEFWLISENPSATISDDLVRIGKKEVDIYGKSSLYVYNAIKAIIVGRKRITKLNKEDRVNRYVKITEIDAYLGKYGKLRTIRHAIERLTTRGLIRPDVKNYRNLAYTLRNPHVIGMVEDSTDTSRFIMFNGNGKFKPSSAEWESIRPSKKKNPAVIAKDIKGIEAELLDFDYRYLKEHVYDPKLYEVWRNDTKA